jgi:hypothetical protein
LTKNKKFISFKKCWVKKPCFLTNSKTLKGWLILGFWPKTSQIVWARYTSNDRTKLRPLPKWLSNLTKSNRKWSSKINKGMKMKEKEICCWRNFIRCKTICNKKWTNYVNKMGSRQLTMSANEPKILQHNKLKPKLVLKI